MATTKINTGKVIDASAKASSAHSTTANVGIAVSSIRRRIDGSILARNGVAGSFTTAQNTISELARDIAKIYQMANGAAGQYESTETSILNEGRRIGLIVEVTDTSGQTSENKATYEAYFENASGAELAIEDSKRAKNGWDYTKDFFEWWDETNGDFSDWCPDDKLLVAAKLFGEGMTFTTTTDASGKIRLVLNNAKGYTKAEMAEKLEELFSTRNWTGYDAKVFQRDGIALFKNGNELSGYEKLKLSDTMKTLEFDDAVDNLKLSSASKMGKTFGEGFVDEVTNFKAYKNFDSLSKIEKAGTIANSVGTGLNVVTNIYENNYNTELGKWEFTGQSVASTVTDTVIDIGTGAAASAAGAAIGSLILPPVGTVVGAVAGLAIDAAINFDGFDTNGDGKNEFGLFDWDKDGSSDSLVDGLKYGVDSLVGSLFD